MTCALYRHYDDDGVLLYVGISNRPVTRFEQHKRKTWAQSVTRIDVQFYQDRERAKRAERFCVAVDRPLFNVRLQGERMPYSRDELGRQMRFTLAEAYAMAERGEGLLATINPVEFKALTRAEQRHHRRMIRRIARRNRSKNRQS